MSFTTEQLDALLNEPTKELSIDIAKLAPDDWCDLSENEQKAVKLKSRSTSGIKTASELKKRILESIHIAEFIGEPYRSMELNRMFGRAARDYDVKVSDLIDQLIVAGFVRDVTMGKVVFLMTEPHYKYMQANMGSDFKDCLITFMQNAIDRTTGIA